MSNGPVPAAQRGKLLKLGTTWGVKGLDAQLAELVEMRYFGGMTVEDVALATGLSEPTIKRRWQVARSWLVDALQNPIDQE